MQKKLRFFKLVIFSLIFFLASTTQAANLTCQYGNGDKYSVKDGSWLGEVEFDSIIRLKKIVFEATNDVMEKLESKKLFFAGEKEQGKVYIVGESKRFGKQILFQATKKEGEQLTTYSGKCKVTF